MTNAELIKALREVANWIVAMSYNSEYAHDELKMLHYEDSIRAAADALEAAEQRIAELMLDCEVLQQKCMELHAKIPKEGEWIEQDDGNSIYHKCSVCGKNQYNVLLEMMQGDYHYCPNCGAKMKGANDGET